MRTYCIGVLALLAGASLLAQPALAQPRGLSISTDAPSSSRAAEEGTSVVVTIDVDWTWDVWVGFRLTDTSQGDLISGGDEGLFCFKGENLNRSEGCGNRRGSNPGFPGTYDVTLYRDIDNTLNGTRSFNFQVWVDSYETGEYRGGNPEVHYCPNGRCGSIRSARGYVKDQAPPSVDPAGVLAVDVVEVTEGDTANFQVSFTPFSADDNYRAFSATVSTADGDALAGRDYRSRTQTLRFRAWDRLSTAQQATGIQTFDFRVSTIEDRVHDPNTRVFDVLLSDVDIVGVDIRNGFGVIMDDDAVPEPPQDTAPEVRGTPIGGLTLDEGGSGTMTFRTCDPSVQDSCVPMAPQGTATIGITAIEGAEFPAHRSPSDGCADYSFNDTTLSFSGTSPRTVTVRALWDDCHDEPSEQLSLALDNRSSNVSLDGDTYHVRIANFRPSIEASVVLKADDSARFNEGETVRFTVELDRYPSPDGTGPRWPGTATVDFVVEGDTDFADSAAPEDFTVLSPSVDDMNRGKLTFSGSRTRITISVRLTARDGVDPPFEGLRLRLSNPSDGLDILTTAVSVTVVDVSPMLTVTALDGGAVPEGTTARFEVARDPTWGEVTVVATAAPGPMTEADDFTAYSETVTLRSGQRRQIVEIQTTGDIENEWGEAETVTLGLSGATNALIDGDADTASVRIVDDDAPLLVVPRQLEVSEGGSVEVVPALAGEFASDGESVVRARVTSGSATCTASTTAPDRDCAAPTKDFTFTTGMLVADEALEVATFTDSRTEEREYFDIEYSIHSGDGVALPEPASTRVYIIDSTAAPTLPSVEVSDIVLFEGETGRVTVTAEWPSALPQNLRRSISVRYATMVGTAVQADFNARSGTVSLSPPRAPATTRSTTISVSTRTDALVERDEYFTVALTERDNYRVMDHGIVTIRDRSATVSISDVTVAEGMNAVLTVGVAGRVSGPARVSYYTRQRTARADLDYRDVRPQPGQVVDIPAGENPTATISINAYADTLTDEGDETFEVVLVSPVGLILGDFTATVTITDGASLNPVAFADVEIGLVPISVEEGSNAVFNIVALGDFNGGSATVTVSLVDGTATQGTRADGADFQAKPAQSFVFNNSSRRRTFSTLVYDDGDDTEGSETFKLHMSATKTGTYSLVLRGDTFGTAVDPEVDVTATIVPKIAFNAAKGPEMGPGPSVTLTPPPNAAADGFVVTAVFSTPVTGFGPDDVVIESGAAEVLGVTGSGAMYTITLLPTREGAVTLVVRAAAAMGLTGPSSASEPLTVRTMTPVPALPLLWSLLLAALLAAGARRARRATRA